MSQEESYERLDVEHALQDELENIQSAVVDSYTDIVKAALEDVLNNAGLNDASVSEVSVEPPDNIIPSQNSTCFNVYVPKVGHVKICIPS